ncbi:uncharacterized protein LOC130741145 [Lotus japonicus]|uniref:uncharacterized protein LOC130741145 n=1 Tax=Lotus japonicus TaxID=34305 RepID=UPI00258AB9D3|nr:uncharacterized protein LOC130741145 [Lotus japonicus]
MMRGSKRMAVSEPNHSDTTETAAFRNKRVMEGSLFDAHRAEPSQQPTVSTPPLDMKRAESSQQHVRALNTQFASWIQTQLKNHPDELWEDGVRDYLDHASSIMEKFSDVVSWLKANATKAEILAPDGGTSFAGKKFFPEATNKENKTFGEKTGSTPFSTATTFAGQKYLPEVSNKENKIFGENTGFTPVSTATTFAGKSFSPEVSNKENKAFGEKTGFSPVSTATTFAGKIFSPEVSNKENKAFGEKTGFSPVSTATTFAGKSFSPEVSNKENKSFGEKTGSPPVSTTTTFASSWTPGLFSNSQNVFAFGNQSSAPSNHGASDDVDGDNDEEQPSSPSVKKSEEKGVVVVHEAKCKLYVKSSDPADNDAWKDKGMGQLSIKCKEGVSKATRESKPTIVVRNEVGKILLNALLYPGIKTNLQKNSVVAIFHTSGNPDGSGGDNDSVVARTFLIRMKTEDDRNKLASTIQEYAPTS